MIENSRIVSHNSALSSDKITEQWDLNTKKRKEKKLYEVEEHHKFIAFVYIVNIREMRIGVESSAQRMLWNMCHKETLASKYERFKDFSLYRTVFCVICSVSSCPFCDWVTLKWYQIFQMFFFWKWRKENMTWILYFLESKKEN